MKAIRSTSLVGMLVVLGVLTLTMRSVPRGIGWAQAAPLFAVTEPMTDTAESTLYLPFVAVSYNRACQPIPGVTYAALSVVNPHNPDAENDAGYNLGLLGYEITDAYAGLVDYNGGEDPSAPQFPHMFQDVRLPVFPTAYRLFHGDGQPVTDWPVTMLGMEVEYAEMLRVPESGYRIDPQGFQAMVIYASEERIAINYTRSDTLYGYSLYVEDICVEPSLLALYRQLDGGGRNYLPALYGGQPMGRATDTEIRVVVRDTGSAMDPRSRKDWWRGW